MCRSLVLVILFSFAVDTAAQSIEPADAPSVTMDGAFGFGQVYNGRLNSGGRLNSLFGFEIAADVRYQRHSVGLRTRAFMPFLFGSNQLWEIGTIYSLNILGNLSLGAGVSYTSEVFDSVQAARIGIPLEIMIRFHHPQSLGPYVRGFANVNDESTFGGVSVGITL